MTEKCQQKAPKHLKAATRVWFEGVLNDYELEPHHVRLLTLAGESWDRCQQAREAIDKHGPTFDDRWGNPRPRPEIKIEVDSRIAFARLLRELGLDVANPGEGRPPVIHGNASRRRT